MVGAQKTETFPGLGVEYWFGKEMYELVDFFPMSVLGIIKS